MPSQKQEFSFPGKTAEELLLISFGAASELGWTPRYAGPFALVLYTPKSWNKNDDEVMIESGDGVVVVTSSLVHGESFDMTGKNKKHIIEFINAFEKIKDSEIQEIWAIGLDQLRQQTITVVQEESKKAEEVDKVMNLSGSNLYITYGIIAINVIVFVLMAMNGAGIFDANGLVHIRWGSNYTTLTLTGDWWRLVTCMFLHFGIIHLAMNTYALYMAGVYLEPMLGKPKYIIAYLSTGVLASVASLWWHDEGVNSAGASGAIFGLYGVFLALLFTNLIPKQVRISLLQSIGVFVVFNLVYGMKSGVDNAAHIGGLLSGMLIGGVYYFSLSKGDEGRKKNLVAIPLVLLTAFVAWFYLGNSNKPINTESRKAVLNELDDLKFKDGARFFEKLNEVYKLEDAAIAPLRDSTINDIDLAQQLKESSAPQWEKAKAILEGTKDYDISDRQKTKRDLLLDYIKNRQEEIAVIEKMASETSPENNEAFYKIREKINSLILQIRELN